MHGCLFVIDAKEAERLSKDESLNTLLDALRLEALNDLANVEADKPIDVLRLQQKVAAIDDIRIGLKNPAILQATSARIVA